MTDEQLTWERDEFLRRKQLREYGAQRNELREQHIREQINAPKPENLKIPENIFVKPLHRDPAQHLQLLAVFLMFRTRFSVLPVHQHNLYSRVCGKFPLFEMFDKDFVEGSCHEYGVDFERIHLFLDELWKAKVFSMSSSLMRDLRMYTDEDAGSDRFRKAVGLPTRKSSASDDEMESGNNINLNAKNLQQLIEELNTPPSSPSPERSEGTSGSVSKAARAGDRTPPPINSRYLIIISNTSLHGGKNNIYNPTLLRRPNAAIIPIPNIQESQSIPNNSGTRSEFWASGSIKQDATNRQLSANTSRVSQTGSSGTSTCSQSTQHVVGVWPGFKDISVGSQRPDTTNSPSPSVTSDLSRTGNSEYFAQFQSTHSELRAESGFENILTDSDESGSMHITQSAVTSEFPVDDAMDIDIPSLKNQARPSLVRSASSSRLATNASRSRSGSVAMSTSQNRRDRTLSKSSTVVTAMNDMRIDHSRVIKQLRKSCHTPSAAQQMVTDFEELGMSTMNVVNWNPVD
ncbi:hypothetical protein EYC80_000846 [Monilinia laxa]|uniref:Uncharacterized protein n=1 Tax=Monilinia laxa TaxID=61186 RepID=A0A5N6K7C4_MONLA|nr:hypothetical protein EYC80_000846 [Monilinia laxa]